MDTTPHDATILVADDDETIVDIVHIALSRRGYSVLTALEGKEALDLARSSCPDLILLDKKMPEMQGHDVLKLLKGDETTRRIPVVMLTGTTDAVDVAESLRLGAADYIVKPFASEDLLRCVRNALAGAHRTEEAV